MSNLEEQLDPSVSPDYNSADLPELSAEKAFEQILSGQPLANVRVSGLTFRGEITCAIRIQHCVLIRPCFKSATFLEGVQIVGCTIDRPNFQKKNVFHKGLDLSGSRLSRWSPSRVEVHGLLKLANAVGRGRFFWKECQFHGDFNAWDAQMLGWLEFKGCQFHSKVDLRSLHVDQGLILQECEFKGDLLLRGATIAKKLDLGTSRFEALIDLSKAKLHDFVYMEQIKSGPQQKFAFLNAVAPYLLIEPCQLHGRLLHEQQGEYCEAMQEYGLLKKSYQELHRYDQEDWAFYNFKVNQRRSMPRSWLRPLSKLAQFCSWLLLDLGCGYGTHPRRAVRTGFLIVFLFTLIYAVGISQFHLEKLPFPDQPAASLSNRLVVSLLLSVTVFTSGLSGIRELAQGWMNLPLILESILGTLLWGLFIVAFSRKVIR